MGTPVNSEGGVYAANFHSQWRSERQVPHLWRCWQIKSQKRWKEVTSHHEHCFEVEQSIYWWRSLVPYFFWQAGIGRSCKRYVTGSWERKVVTSIVCNRETAGTLYYSWRTRCCWWCIGRSSTSVKSRRYRSEAVLRQVVKTCSTELRHH